MRVASQKLTAEEFAEVAWRLSSRSSSGGGSCVEAGPFSDGSGRVAVRHSHHPDARILVYTEAEWQGFTARLRDGTFDFPAG